MKPPHAPLGSGAEYGVSQPQRYVQVAMTHLNPTPGGYDEQVAVRYDAAVPIRAGEIDFYLGLAQDAHAKGYSTLEIACGSGRVAVPLARQGIPLVGLDLSPAMLEAARKKSAGIRTVQWVDAGMNILSFAESTVCQ